jgi:fermentation-respiration switch protein FrsA (DUF1100 family)
MSSQKVYFYSEGLKIEGILFGHNNTGLKPGIIVCQGFGGVKEITALPIAEFLAGKGYVTLCLDYRYFGASEGEPRGRIIPMHQVEDICNAITYLQQQPGVDPGCIGLYGSSYGGSNVMYAAAIDQRVKCTVATAPVTNSYEWQRQMRRNWEWVKFLEEVAENRVQMVLTGKSKVVDRSELMLNDPDTAEFTKNAPPVSVTLESADHILKYNPEELVHRIAPCPLQIIYCEKDILVNPEQQKRAYELAGKPKRLCELKGAAHFDVYSSRFEETMNLATEWFNQWLLKN